MENEIYDYVILGGGMRGLATASLLAQKGKSVCLIEANSKVGGHAYTMEVGKYQFCHDVQYLMGCQSGGPMHKFLRMLNLDEKIKFNKMDSKSYDLISIKDKQVDIPLGMTNYLKELIDLYPEYERELTQYFEIESKVVLEAKGYEQVLTKWHIIKAPWKYLTIIRYMNYTLDDMFNKFNFSQELRAILAGRMGNLSASPKEVSFLMYAAMDVAYSDSAYFPKKGMKFLIEEVEKKITEKNNCKVCKETIVKKIKQTSKKISSVQTSNGEIYGKEFISNIDPYRTFNLVENMKIPRYYKKRLNYNYSDSIFCIYLGLKNINLKEVGFKKRNIWHHSDFDLNKEYWSEIKKDKFVHPWLFISTPSILADEGELCPKNHQTFEILTFANYDHFKKLYNLDKSKYKDRVNEIYEEILDIVDKNYLPNIRDYIESITIHTPIDMENILLVPKGNVYGCRLTPKNLNYNRITSKTPMKNLHLVGANASFPGIMGVTVGAMELFEKLNKKD